MLPRNEQRPGANRAKQTGDTAGVYADVTTPEPYLRAAAQRYGERGITVVPLGLDEDGLPKKPMSDFYPRFKPDDNATHDWNRAAGIGIVLGRPSGCLAVIDVDDLGLSDFLTRRLSLIANRPLMVRTARGRLHIYVQETAPSKAIDLQVLYQGRRCLVQLLAGACQASAPPSPGYSWIDSKAEPLYGAIADVWRRLSLAHGLPYREASPYSFLRRERSRGPTTAQLREATDVGS